MICNNCAETAKYELRQKPASQLYCAAHVPWFIKLHKDLGTKIFEISATNAKPVDVPAVVEPIVEETIEEASVEVEEPVAEETTEEVEKKPIKKKA